MQRQTTKAADIFVCIKTQWKSLTSRPSFDNNILNSLEWRLEYDFFNSNLANNPLPGQQPNYLCSRLQPDMCTVVHPKAVQKRSRLLCILHQELWPVVKWVPPMPVVRLRWCSILWSPVLSINWLVAFIIYWHCTCVTQSTTTSEDIVNLTTVSSLIWCTVPKTKL